MHPRLRGILAISAMVALIVGLHALSSLGLRGPAGFTRNEIDLWLNDPIIALTTVLRWVCIILAYYLATVMVAVFVFGESVQRSKLGWALPSHAVGVAGLLLGVGAVAMPLTARLVADAEPPAPTASETTTLVALGQPPVLERLDDRSSQTGSTDGAGTSGVSTPMPETRATPATSIEDTWTVEPGESFWAIAEEHLADSWGRQELSDAEIARYWRALMAANADRLVEPGNPDLLFPGQVLELPDTPQPG